jgi:hypothetical protein
MCAMDGVGMEMNNNYNNNDDDDDRKKWNKEESLWLSSRGGG